jgi:hypothetical protein
MDVYEKGGMTMKKIMKAIIIGLLIAMLTVGSLGLYNYFKKKRS